MSLKGVPEVDEAARTAPSCMYPVTSRVDMQQAVCPRQAASYGFVLLSDSLLLATHTVHHSHYVVHVSGALVARYTDRST